MLAEGQSRSLWLRAILLFMGLKWLEASWDSKGKVTKIPWCFSKAGGGEGVSKCVQVNM